MNKKPKIVRTEPLEKLVNAFAAHLEAEKLRGLVLHRVDCEANRNNCKVSVKWGKSWIRVDVGGSGNYMVDAAGDIYGIKAYGVPHLGHRYGNLETIHAWDWAQGHSYAVRKPATPAPAPAVNTNVQIATLRGAASYKAGAARFPMADDAFMKMAEGQDNFAELCNAWLKAWDQANLSSPVPVVPPVMLPPFAKPAVPEHVPSPCPNLTRFYFWDMDGKPTNRFNRDHAVRGFVQSIFALSAQEAATLAGVSIIQACPSWAVCKDTTGDEFQMTWRTRS